MASIFNIFARSPTAPLQEHMAKVVECAETLVPFFEAVFADHWENASFLRDKVASLENEADNIKRNVRCNLPKGLFTAVSRGDVLALLGLQDLIANRAKDIAGVVLGRRMHFPIEIAEQFVAFLKRSIEAASQASLAIHELDELEETGFIGKEAKTVEKMIVTLADIEHETDGQQIKIRAVIFEMESGMPPVDVMFLYQIIEWVGQLADKAQNVGDRLQLLLSR
jgi:uncharacterized protein